MRTLRNVDVIGNNLFITISLIIGGTCINKLIYSRKED